MRFSQRVHRVVGCGLIGLGVWAGASMGHRVMASDGVLEIDQSVVNLLLSGIGSVSGSGNAAVINQYQWTVKNPRLTFGDGTALFEADADIKTGSMTYQSPVKGEIAMGLNESATAIKMTLSKASVQLGMSVFGQYVPLTTLDVTQFYKPSFEIPIPLSVSTFAIDVPGGTNYFELMPKVQSLQLKGGKLALHTQLNITKKPAPALPIANAKPATAAPVSGSQPVTTATAAGTPSGLSTAPPSPSLKSGQKTKSAGGAPASKR